MPLDADLNQRDSRGSFPIVGVGASAGGLEAFTQLLAALPPDTGMGFVLVQHLDPEHESALAQILSRATSLPVHEVTNNQPVQPNQVYVIPRDTSLTIAAGVLKLEPRARIRVPHRPIDAFFESLAADQGDRAIGVVLSGTATDGTLGLEAIKAEGGITFAQDDSAKHGSMPRSAVAAGCVDLVLSPADIAQELARIAKHPYAAGSAAKLATSPEERQAEAESEEATRHEDDATPLPPGGQQSSDKAARRPRAEAARASATDSKEGARGADEGYKRILLLLRNHSGVDFSLYKSTTIQRRINRRMILTKHDTLVDYAAFLRGNTKELDALYTDVLISVTSFFRNPEMFDILQREVIPQLLKQRGDGPLRCWVLGCSTGQEAYSIAMSFVEVAEEATQTRKLQIFATDLNDALLEKARQGLYAKSLAEEITPARLRRFFIEEEGGYRISKSLREMVVFARQNLIADPPFSRMDIISCRNLLIYLEPSLQKKALPVFHYSLRPGGYLLLGASESIGGFTDLFEPVDKKHKIYAKKPAPTPAFHLPATRPHGELAPADARPVPTMRAAERPDPPDALRGELNAQREADRITVNQFAPPGVLINAELQVLQFRGPTGAYLQPPAGKASFDVLKMAREGLMLPLRSAIQEAKKEDKSARRENVRIQDERGERQVNLEVIPLKNLRERGFLIFFEEVGAGGARRLPAREAPAAPLSKEQELSRSAELETELAETREYLQSMQEQHEAANEELQAANEEVQSANEELQSINEELETSKEELESANEELTTLNEEMNNRNVELNRLNNDLVNLQASTKLAVVLLGRDLAIRRFSPQAEKQFDLLSSDLGRPVGHIRHGLVSAPAAPEQCQAGARGAQGDPIDLESLIVETIGAVREQEREVQDKSGRWYLLRLRPYLTLDNKVDGAVLMLVDIEALKRAEQVIANARDYTENIVQTVRLPLLVLDKELRIENANSDFYRTFRVAPQATIGRRLYDLGNRQWDIPRLRSLLEEILPQDKTMENFQVEHDFESIGPKVMLINARRILDPQRTSERILLAIEDVTEERRMADELRQRVADMSDANHRKDEFLATLAHELRNPLAPIRNTVQILLQSDGADDALRAASATLERQVAQMVRLVDDLLDVSRISRGAIKLRKGRVELASVVHHAVEAARPLTQSRNHELAVTLPQQPIHVEADALRLTQVLSNLLSNASKFTDQGGRIWLTVQQEDHQAVIRVRDSGIGIAADQLSRIFEMFTQVDTSLERSVSGLGIGLSLVKNLVELHGGVIEAHSPGIGLGSEFVVRLPVANGAPQPQAAPPTAPQARNKIPRRILVVDDNRDSALTLALLLKSLGHATLTAYDGLEAVEAAESFRPEAVLLDIGLPKLNGLEACRRIREQPWGRDIVMIALTGWGQDGDRQKSKDAGFNGHLVKPVAYSDLENMMAELLPAPE